MKYWWCQTCNLPSTARCKYRNNIFFHVFTKIGISQYHRLQSPEMDNSNITKWFEKWAYCFWEYLPEHTSRMTSYVCHGATDTSSTLAPPNGNTLKTFTLRSSEHEKGAEKAKKSNNGMSETKVFLFTVIPHFGLNRNEHNSNGRRLYKYLHGGQCMRLLPEMGLLGSHISQHLGRQIKIRKVNKHKMFSPNDLLLQEL